MAGTPDYAIGIDLGTTNCCVSVYRNGQVEIIANGQGNRLTPSFVAFTNERVLVGESAKYQRSANLDYTVYEVKRLIGRRFKDDIVQESIKLWPFRVISDDENPRIVVNYRGTEKIYTPEEISAMLLGEMKEIAENYLGYAVRKAVITVPAYFTDSQRQATIDAGTIAGLQVLKIINEPTAAAIAYGEDVQVANSKNILIFDFGGGTFDVSILNMKKGQYVVKAIQGNSHLGGSDLDNRLCEHLTAEFRASTGIDISQNHKAQSKIRTAAEQTKINLSSQLRDNVQIECVHQGQDLRVTMSRIKFEHLCDDLFQKTMRCVDDALTDAGLTVDSIDEVVLVGGSAWIPKIEKMVTDKFAAGKVRRNINPAEAVAYGAAVQAAMLNDGQRVEDIKLSDVTPLSLGADYFGDRLGIIIKRNSPVPAKSTATRTTVYDYQKDVLFRVYEGENPTASKNNYLGEFTVENIELAPAGVPKFDVTFALDSNGILNATAVDRKTGSRGNVTVSVNKGRLVKEEIDRMVTEMRDVKAHEVQHRALIDASASLEETIAKKRSLLERKKTLKKISQRDYERILRECDEAESWLDDHEDATKREFDEKEREFNQSFTALFTELRI